MGNRALIVLESTMNSLTGKTASKDRGPVIYLQWNGGPESVYAFLKELDNRGMRVNDTTYETARLVHVIGDFFDHDSITTLSLGLQSLTARTNAELAKLTDGVDNGMYLVNRGKKTVKRCVGGEWLTEAEVEKERKAAVRHAKYKDIVKTLKADRKGKNIEDIM